MPRVIPTGRPTPRSWQSVTARLWHSAELERPTFVDDPTRRQVRRLSACVDALAAQASRGLTRGEGERSEIPSSGISLAARERYAGSRWHFRCRGQ